MLFYLEKASLLLVYIEGLRRIHMYILYGTVRLAESPRRVHAGSITMQNGIKKYLRKCYKLEEENLRDDIR